MLKTKIEGAKHLLRSYFAAVPRIAYCMSICLIIDPKKSQKFIHQVLDSIDLSRIDPVLGSVSITEMIPPSNSKESQEILISAPYYSEEGSDTRNIMELSVLAYLVRMTSASVVFEIGTFIGRTTRLFAQNTPPNAKIITLDLSQEDVKHQIGRDYKTVIEAGKIKQLYGDSRTFDFTPYHGICDFIWIDGNHDYSFVKSDTENALKLVKPGGWIGWHDYHQTARWSGVTKNIHELKKYYPGIRHIKNTTIALLQC